MRRAWQVLRNTLIWSYERGSLPYDLMVIAILLFVFLSPRGWFRDQPRAAPEPPAAEVSLLGEDEAGLRTYRIEARVLAASLPAEPPSGLPDSSAATVPSPAPESSSTEPAAPASDDELKARLMEILRAHVAELRDSPFEISNFKPVLAPDGSLSHYEVTIRP
jgi:hypothetical protein